MYLTPLFEFTHVTLSSSLFMLVPAPPAGNVQQNDLVPLRAVIGAGSLGNVAWPQSLVTCSGVLVDRVGWRVDLLVGPAD